MGTEKFNDDLSDADFVNLLRRVSSDLQFRKSIKKRVWLFIGALILLALVSIASVISLIYIRKFQSEACNRDNRLREAYVNQWTPVLAQTPPPEPPPPGSSQKIIDSYVSQVNLRTSFVNSLSNGFAQHDC